MRRSGATVITNCHRPLISDSRRWFISAFRPSSATFFHRSRIVFHSGIVKVNRLPDASSIDVRPRFRGERRGFLVRGPSCSGIASLDRCTCAASSRDRVPFGRFRSGYRSASLLSRNNVCSRDRYTMNRERCTILRGHFTSSRIQRKDRSVLRCDP